MLHYKGKYKLKNSMHRTLKYIFQNKRKIIQHKTYIFVKLSTIEGDLYNGIPIYSRKDSEFPSYIVENGLIGIAEGKIKNEEMCKVTIMEENCNICEGYIKSEYLSEIKKMEKNKAKNYNKFYTVISDDGADIISSEDTMENKPLINIPKNTYVLANENINLKKINDEEFILIMYINDENKVIEGYIEKSKLEEKKTSEVEAMHVNSQRGISSLKMMPSIYSSAIRELENGTEIYVMMTSKEIVSDNIIWKPVIYMDKATNKYISGWVDAQNLIM